jgi:hypothetical protein
LLGYAPYKSIQLTDVRDKESLVASLAFVSEVSYSRFSRTQYMSYLQYIFTSIQVYFTETPP